MSKSKKEMTQEKTIHVVPEVRYGHDEIISHYRSFGVEQYTLVGALAESGKSELTRSEVEAAIKKFKNKEVEK